MNKTGNVKFDIYGLNNVQPIWADHYFKTISNAKMGLNLSRGEAIKYYSSDRITQIIGNGLVCLIDEKTQYKNFFTEKEMVVRTGVFSSAIISHQREQRFMRLAFHMRHTLPPDTRIAGYPNLAMPMIAAGFVPVTFQGNYFGDDDVDIAAFVADVQEKQVDCVLVNESGWPYSSSFPYFPNSELIVAALLGTYQLKQRYDLVGYYCLADIALSGNGVERGENLR